MALSKIKIKKLSRESETGKDTIKLGGHKMTVTKNICAIQMAIGSEILG